MKNELVIIVDLILIPGSWLFPQLIISFYYPKK